MFHPDRLGEITRCVPCGAQHISRTEREMGAKSKEGKRERKKNQINKVTCKVCASKLEVEIKTGSAEDLEENSIYEIS